MTSALGIDYSATSGNFAAKRAKWARLAANSGSNKTSTTSVAKSTGDTYTSTIDIGDNSCTDGNDDGKISFFSAAGNIIEGVGKAAVNMVKGAVQHPFKTLAVTAACCIPVVGPVIAGGLAAYGLYSGGKQILNAIEVANNATSDAEAKAAFENIGSGALTVGVSYVGLKGSAGMLKRQLGMVEGVDASTTVTAVRNALKSGGKSAGEIAEIAVREGVSETAANIGGIAQSLYNKGKAAYNKAKQYGSAAKEGNLAETMKADVETLANKAGEYVKTKVDKISEEAKKYTKEGRAQAKADAETLRQSQIDSGARIDVSKLDKNALPEGYSIDSKTGQIQITDTDGYISTYNPKTGVLEEVYDPTTGTTTFCDKTGMPTENTSTTQGTRTVKEQTTNNKGNTTTKTTQSNTVDGKTTVEYEETTSTNNKTGVTSSTTRTNGKTTYSETGITTENGFTGVKKCGNTTTWYRNGKAIDTPTIWQKLQIKAEASNAGVTITETIGNGSTKLGSYTIQAKQAEYLSALANEND